MSDFFVTVSEELCEKENLTPGKSYRVQTISEKENPLTHTVVVLLMIQNDNGKKIWLPEEVCQVQSLD